jgi:hypothetical protein
MVKNFKLVTQGLKKEERKYDWLEKPKHFNRTISKYQQFKQSMQWYLYTHQDIIKEDEKIVFCCSLLTEGTTLNWKVNYLLWTQNKI